QCGRQITELLAVMEIDTPVRQNTERYCAYLERLRQCALHRNPETQDRVQGRLKIALEFIQDYLVRAGRRRYNPGPGLFRKVVESNIRDPKEERRLEEDPGLSNSEQRVGDRVFQVRGNNRHSGNNNAQRLCYNNRPLQRDAVWSFNGSENLYQMPSTSNSRGQEAMQLANLRLSRRYSEPELGSHDITTRNIADNEDPTRVQLDDRNGQEPDLSHADSRVLGLAVDHENNDNANNNILKERSVEATKASDGSSQEKETRKNNGLGIGNWRDPIHKCTIQTRRASHQVALKVEGQGSSQQRLEQVDSTLQECNTRHNMEDQQTSSQSTIVLHETQLMDNDPDRCLEFRMGGNTDQRESREGVRTWRVERQQRQEFQLTRSDSGSESNFEIPSRNDLITAYWNTITHKQYCYNVQPQQGQSINYDCSTSRQSHQVSRTILHDNRIQSYSWTFEHYTRQIIKVIQMRKLRIQERSSLEDTQGAWDQDLNRYICNTRELTTHEKVKIERVSIAVSIAPDWPNQKQFTELREIVTQKRCLEKSTKVLLMGAKHTNKGWALQPGLIYIFQSEQRRRKAFQTTVTSQMTEFQRCRPSHLQLIKLMENTLFRTNIAGKIPQEYRLTA
ncbi:MAG: hypothetical protein EZS28_028593, partial [Streblomastix strix]